MSTNPVRTVSLAEVAQHNREGDAWIVVDGGVYDVSKFAPLHPAGKKILLAYAGKDASDAFKQYHKTSLLHAKYSGLKIGEVPRDGSAASAGGMTLTNGGIDPVPFADPSYLQGWESPYFDESHARLRTAVRAFVNREVAPFLEKWQNDPDGIPKDLFKKCGTEGLFAAAVGRPWPKEFFPEQKLFGVALERIDSFHEQILYEEFSRIGTYAIVSALTIGTAVGIPPVLEYGTREQKERVAVPCLRGDKVCALAITEPWAGSDVAAIRTRAVKSECGQYYIVNGMKKWITNGLYADFFTTAVKTSENGISLLVIDRDAPGFSKRRIRCQGNSTTGTSFLVFENVKVPVGNLIGRENEGFRYIMVNFNHERLMIVMGGVRQLRNLVSEALRHAHRRRTFGKALIDHPVIRGKLANMIRETEAAQAYLDQIVYSYDRMPKKQNLAQLSYSLSLMKAQVTRALDMCAREASQIFGGLSYTQTGLGADVENMYREVKSFAVPGGSEEIMLDMAARMSSKLMPKL